jgi:dolichyl-phosphate-mannose-protein mannosyltransferase
MQRSSTKTSTSSISSSAQTALRRNLRSVKTADSLAHESDDDIADPRPWETRPPPNSYGSQRDTSHIYHPTLSNPSPTDRELPTFDMEARRRYGEKEELAARRHGEEKAGLIEDDQGKWAKGHGAGPGSGGRRGLQPKQRIEGWVSVQTSSWA